MSWRQQGWLLFWLNVVAVAMCSLVYVFAPISRDAASVFALAAAIFGMYATFVAVVLSRTRS